MRWEKFRGYLIICGAALDLPLGVSDDAFD